MNYNVFVIGLDPLVEEQLRHIPHASRYNIRPLLPVHDIVHAPEFDLPDLLERARRELRAFPEPIHGIVTCWDFPSSLIAVMLRRELGLPTPNLEAALRCEHKYWSRVVQTGVLPESVPEFQAFDPFVEDPLAQLKLRFPFWIKPVKSYGSHLGFRIEEPEDFHAALPLIRAGIRRLGDPFDYFLDNAEMPPEVASVRGHWCIAEAIISRGRQCTLEGYMQDGRVDIYGVVDSVRHERYRSSFMRYEYPSSLPVPVKTRMIEAGKRMIEAVDLDNSPFNIEFYYDSARDHIWLLEINTRISRSHTPLFHLVDGASHLKVMLDVGVGRPVHAPHRQGRYPVAAKFMLRVFEGGVVEQVPAEADIEAVRQRFPDSIIDISVKPGMDLGELMNQDAYSYEIGVLFLGAGNRDQLMRRYRECLELLPFRFSSPTAAENASPVPADPA